MSLAGDGSVADIYIVNMFALDGRRKYRDYGAYSSVRNLTSEADISLMGTLSQCPRRQVRSIIKRT